MAISEDELRNLVENDVEIRVSIARYELTSRVIRAYDAGEIDLWVEHNRPKGLEEWDEWKKELERRGINDIATRWDLKKD